MRLEQVGASTGVLAALALWAVLLWLLALGGLGSRVGALADDASLLQPLPQAGEPAAERLGPLAERLVPFHGTYDLVPEAMAADLDEQVTAFRSRPLGESGPYVFVAADALTMKVREGGRVINAVVLLDTTLDDQGRNKHAWRLAELRHWAAPLRLPEERATFHVLEAVNPAAALLEYATANPVDHIVMGARGRSASRRLLGSVSAEIAAHAPCTVTVVRPRARVMTVARALRPLSSDSGPKRCSSRPCGVFPKPIETMMSSRSTEVACAAGSTVNTSRAPGSK